MEVIIAIIIVGSLVWFGLAIIGSRKDENGMDAQDRHYHRKAIRQIMERQAERDAHAMAEVAIGSFEAEQRLMDQGLTAEQAAEVSRTRTSRHRDESHAGALRDCTTCDEAAKRDAEMERLLRDDPDQVLAMLEESERALAKAGIVRRPGAPSNREMIEEFRADSGYGGAWTGGTVES